MSEYIVNPRRAPRAPSRCAALVHTPDAAWSSETEDISPLGCQLVAPKPVARGLGLFLVFANPRVQGSLKVEGKVAWGSSQPPWRVGVAFGESSRAQAEHWFSLLVSTSPGLSGVHRVPDRLPVDAMLFLAPPPSLLVDFSPDEVEVLRHVASGTTIAALQRQLASNWSADLRAIFSLMARGVLTVSRSASAHPATWKKVMEELQVDFVLETPRAIRSDSIMERLTAREGPLGEGQRGFNLTASVTPPPELSRRFDPIIFEEEVAHEVAPAPQVPPPLPPPRPAPQPRAVPPPLPTSAGGATAGTGWRGGHQTRSRESQESLDLGRRELAAGRGSSALAHLRHALQLAPGDPEIAAEIGRAMSGG